MITARKQAPIPGPVTLVQGRRFVVVVAKIVYSSILYNIEKLWPAVDVPKVVSESEAKTVSSVLIFKVMYANFVYLIQGSYRKSWN